MKIILSIVLALATTYLHADPSAVSGSLTATGQALTLSISNNNSWGVQLSGTWSGSLAVEGTVNSTSWTQLSGYLVPSLSTAMTITANGVYVGSLPGITRVRLRGSSISSGTVAATLTLADSFPTGFPVTLASGGSATGVSVLTSVLPTGAATLAEQQTQTTALGDILADTTSIDGKTPALGQATKANSVPVVLASDHQNLGVTLVASSIAMAVSVTAFTPTVNVDVLSSALPTGAATFAEQQIQSASLSSIDANQGTFPQTISNNTTSMASSLVTITNRTPALGLATKAFSSPVVLASDSQHLGVTLSAGSATVGNVGITHTVSVQAVAGTATLGNVGITNTVNVVNTAGTAFMGSLSISNTAGAPGNVTLSTITAGAPLPVTLSTITSAAPLAVSLTTISASAPLPVSLPAYTSANPLPVGVTINAITANLQTASGSTSGLNIALAFDYDANTNTATTKRGNPTLTTYQSTSGTATIYGSGYTLITSITVFPATVAGSKVTFFDSTVTKTTISTLAAGFYQFPRGISFGTSCVMVVTGAAFDGAVSVETLR